MIIPPARLANQHVPKHHGQTWGGFDIFTIIMLIVIADAKIADSKS